MIFLWLLTVVAIAIISAIEVNGFLGFIMPVWFVLWACFWGFYQPTKTILVASFVVAFFIDELLQYPLGTHVFALLPIVFFFIRMSERLRVMHFLPKVMLIFLFTLWYQLVLLVSAQHTEMFFTLKVWSSSLATVGLWFVYVEFLRQIIGNKKPSNW